MEIHPETFYQLQKISLNGPMLGLTNFLQTSSNLSNATVLPSHLKRYGYRHETSTSMTRSHWNLFAYSNLFPSIHSRSSTFIPGPLGTTYFPRCSDVTTLFPPMFCSGGTSLQASLSRQKPPGQTLKRLGPWEVNTWGSVEFQSMQSVVLSNPASR